MAGPISDWVDYTPNSIWIYVTHFPRANMAVLIIEDLVSRKWITEIVSVEETSTQVELAFTAELEAEGLLEAVDARSRDGLVDLGVDEETRPILLAVSDNGPQMTSGSTRKFGVVRDRPALRAPRNPNRPGLDRVPERAHQDRVTAPARDP